MSPTVSIVIVSYNTRDLTLNCIRSVLRETQIAHEIIVVDNASSDESAEAIANEFPNVTLLPETVNHGFAGGNNIGTKHARGEYILLLNPDTVVLDGAVDELVAFARSHPEAKIWGGRTLNADGTLNRTCCFQKMTLWRVFCRAFGLASAFSNHRFFSEVYGGWNMDNIRQVDIVTGCFLLIKRQLWEDLGGFDVRYFMYGEEADLCLRAARDYGAAPLFTPTAQIIHHGRASETVAADRMVRLLRAKICLVQDHFPRWQRGSGEFLMRMVPFGRHFVLSLASRLQKHPDRDEAARTWSEIWARRAEWWDGYTTN